MVVTGSEHPSVIESSVISISNLYMQYVWIMTFIMYASRVNEPFTRMPYWSTIVGRVKTKAAALAVAAVN